MCGMLVDEVIKVARLNGYSSSVMAVRTCTFSLC